MSAVRDVQIVAIRVHLDLGARTGLRRFRRQRRQSVEWPQRAICRVVRKGRDSTPGLVADVEELSGLSKGEMTRRGAKLRRLEGRRGVRRQRARHGVEAVHHNLVEALLRDEQEPAVRRQQHAMRVRGRRIAVLRGRRRRIEPLRLRDVRYERLRRVGELTIGANGKDSDGRAFTAGAVAIVADDRPLPRRVDEHVRGRQAVRFDATDLRQLARGGIDGERRHRAGWPTSLGRRELIRGVQKSFVGMDRDPAGTVGLSGETQRRDRARCCVEPPHVDAFASRRVVRVRADVQQAPAGRLRAYRSEGTRKNRGHGGSREKGASVHDGLLRPES